MSNKNRNVFQTTNMAKKKQQLEDGKVYTFDLAGSIKFGTLTEEVLNESFKDGRLSSHLIEKQLEDWFFNLEHVEGCKDHDHIDRMVGKKYDAKNFTKNGCKFMPSSMIGTGRVFEQKLFEEKASSLHYIICDIVDFPKIRVISLSGADLVNKYKKGNIPLGERSVLFS